MLGKQVMPVPSIKKSPAIPPKLFNAGIHCNAEFPSTNKTDIESGNCGISVNRLLEHNSQYKSGESEGKLVSKLFWHDNAFNPKGSVGRVESKLCAQSIVVIVFGNMG